jgi:hypothetical protein
MKLNRYALAALALGTVGVSALAWSAVQTPKPVASLDQILPPEQHMADAGVQIGLPTIELPAVVITARLPKATSMTKKQVTVVSAGPCNWDWRPVVQGPVGRQVRGFCTD